MRSGFNWKIRLRSFKNGKVQVRSELNPWLLYLQSAGHRMVSGIQFMGQSDQGRVANDLTMNILSASCAERGAGRAATRKHIMVR